MLSWNVNGIRAAHKKGFLDWLYNDSPDIIGLQETKAEASQLPSELAKPKGYNAYFASSKTKKGYSGVAVYSKKEPNEVDYGIGVKEFDEEGRTLILYFDDFTFINCYFPNSGMGPHRVKMKLTYNDALLSFMEKHRKKQKHIIVCGDFNVAHEEIDLARPKENVDHAGFLPEERAWVDELVGAGYVDTFRHFYPTKINAYSWWDMKSRARDRNVGWRIDYFFITPALTKNLKSAFILDHVMGSDHAPVGIELSSK
jgi:exodeoxyribonuclease-3